LGGTGGTGPVCQPPGRRIVRGHLEKPVGITSEEAGNPRRRQRLVGPVGGPDLRGQEALREPVQITAEQMSGAFHSQPLSWREA
jgi:hypothetical protein